MKNLQIKYTNIEDEDVDEFAEAFVKSLNKGSMESMKRSERFDKIFAIEVTKWPYDMGKKNRSDIPEELYEILDACITYSQKVARDACQTEELTEKYLRENAI
ncbi:MAG: hypothetical protein IT284_02250 [Bacteroidetes bacterium]|nr:hypothetical protein [Bacteroidota bacterium]